MRTVLKSKRVSYGLVELIDTGITSPRYVIEVNGVIKKHSDDLYALTQMYEREYY